MPERLFGSVWASHFLSAVIASERCFCVVSPFHAKRLLKTSTMAAIIVVGCTLLTAGMCAIVAPKHISVCRFDPLTNITDNIVYTTTAASSTSSDGDLKMTHKEASVTRMLMATSVLFIVCITPNLLLQVTTLVVPDFSQTGLYQHLISSCWRIVYCFWMMNSSCPFFVYFKMGSKFRGMDSHTTEGRKH
ncbi:hypothetical protein C0Q70_19745 [Pomacea canaliculata]|uniref:G-protein coupled receptors family 1 profile domain-containing protein n=1 Tax=Pomacea canaliculata TaxID=400727 RepID=A0A2T7NDL6_POMCA|nr:hypothetical protein C0Q70_19745 [Pomacea canaliculata]